MQIQACLPLRIQAATNNAAVLWVLIPAHETGTGIEHVTQFPSGNHIYMLWTIWGGIWNRKPNRGMSGGETHQAGSQGVTVPNLMHPWPTFNMGWDKGSVPPLI
jgi:hypothetical protein